MQTLWTRVVAWLQVLQLRGSRLHVQLFDVFVRCGAVSPVWSARGPGGSPSQRTLLEDDSQSYVKDSSSEVLILSDGRELGIAYYGARVGPAVFYLHGYPGCRLSAGAFLDPPGRELGVRIISMDRPGLGNSSPQPGRNLLDHARDIGEVAELLDLESYGIIAVSGGGPYALACAYLLPEKKLKAISIIGGMGPLDAGTKGMSWGNWFIFQGLLYVPFLIRWLQYRVLATLRSVSNEKIIEKVAGRLSDPSSRWISPDLKTLGNPTLLNMVLDVYREHYKQGIDGNMEDGRVLVSDWGFHLEDIRPTIPVQLWYSKKDTNVPFQMGEAICRRLKPRPDFYVDEEETHLNLVIKYSAKALHYLVDKL